MRITDNMQFEAIRRQMASAQAQNFKASQVASSGSRLSAPSDDPIAAAEAIRVQAAIDQSADYRETIRKVQGDAELSESALANATDIVGRAHDIALLGGSGNITQTERSALAVEVHGLREQLLAAANQKGAMGYLFGGTATGSAPFGTNTVFVGNSLDRVIEVAPNVTTVVNTSGAQAFTVAGGRNLFDDLQSLETALSANDANAVQSTVNNLDIGVRQIVAARVDAGIKAARLSAADSAQEQAALSLSQTRKGLVDADQASSYSNLLRAQQGVEAAVEVSKQMLSTLQVVNRLG